MSQPPSRRSAGSHTTTPRPGEPTGRGPDAAGADEVGPAAEETPPPGSSAVPGEQRDRRGSGRRPGVWPAWWGSEALTVVLLGALALVVLAGLALAGALIYDRGRDADGGTAPEALAGGIAVPGDRPVLVSEPTWQEGVDAAARAAQEIVAVDHARYDREVDEAAALMTDDFAETYRRTAARVRQQIIDRKTVVQAEVAARGVVRANETRLQALVFLNQLVRREDDRGATNVITPYKVLVTMVHTDHGWFVDRLDTDDVAPATGAPTSPTSPTSPTPATGD